MKVKNVILVSFLLLVLPATILLADSHADETITVNITVEKYVMVNNASVPPEVSLALEDQDDGTVTINNIEILANFPYSVELQSENRGDVTIDGQVKNLPFAMKGEDKIFYDARLGTGASVSSPRQWFSETSNGEAVSVSGQPAGNTEVYSVLVKSQFQDYAGELELALSGEYADTLVVSVVER